MKSELIEQIRKIHGRILSATESIDDTVHTDAMLEWQRNHIHAMCKQIDECVKQLEEAMKHESN